MDPITSVTRLPATGQTTISVTPPKPCGLGNCVGELHVTIGHDSMRLHLGPQQREGLISALGGGTEMSRAVAEDLAYDRGYRAGHAFALNDPALPDANERAEQRGLGRR